MFRSEGTHILLILLDLCYLVRAINDHNGITGFLLYTMFSWSGSCPGLERADTGLETELSWA